MSDEIQKFTDADKKLAIKRLGMFTDEEIDKLALDDGMFGLPGSAINVLGGQESGEGIPPSEENPTVEPPKEEKPKEEKPKEEKPAPEASGAVEAIKAIIANGATDKGIKKNAEDLLAKIEEAKAAVDKITKEASDFADKNKPEAPAAA